MKRKIYTVLISLIIFFLLSSSIIFFTAYFRELPEPSFPKIASKPTLNGSLIELESHQTISLVSYDNISNHFLDAIVAIEDHRFYEHNGVDILSIFRAFISNLSSGDFVGSGGSTITQQFARNSYDFLSQRKVFSRKIAEAATAYKVEKKYSKNDIIKFYCNIIYVGHGLYGVEYAANYYFGKSAKDLTLNEAATIAGLLKSPGYYSPYVSMEKAVANRNIVLARMAELEYIPLELAQEEQKKPINLVK
ncbi:MAG: transglycosylase domain-containing protein [Clostridia bacterium]